MDKMNAALILLVLVGASTVYADDGKTIDVETGNDASKYQFYPVPSEVLEFEVKASNDAHTVLTTKPADANPKYEIFIGAYSNTLCLLRRDGVRSEKAVANTKDILSKDEYRGFYITWTNGLVKLGHAGELTSILQWQDPNPFNVTYFGVATGYGSTGSWRIKDNSPPPPPPNDPANPVTGGNPDTSGTVVSALTNGLGQTVGGLGTNLGGTLGSVGQGVGDVVGGVGKLLGGVTKGVGTILGGVGKTVGDVLGGVGGTLGNVTGEVGVQDLLPQKAAQP